MKEFIEKNREYIYETLKELCLIPAPSHKEQKRAEYCKTWLENQGADGVYIDDALNVVFPYNCDGSNNITVFAAHTDTVFPDMESMPYLDDGEKIHCPGIADDTSSVVALMFMAKYFIENNIHSPNGILFVCNSCEEGLGNLKGVRQIFETYNSRVAQFITFDNQLDTVADRCVGSHRYEVEVKTEGGHSLGDFGNDNAIAKISEIVTEIYKIRVPEKSGTLTTYNAGVISGGTSVNTIAQSANLLCEYRSDDRECLEIMEKKFAEIFDSVRTEKVEVEVTRLGERPCMNIEQNKQNTLKEKVLPAIEETIGEKVKCVAMSTDCNIPLSLGVPALCVGTSNHYGIHTREEWMNKESLLKGLEIAIKTGLILK